MARKGSEEKKTTGLESWEDLSRAERPDKRYLLGEGPNPDAPPVPPVSSASEEGGSDLELHAFIHDVLPLLDSEQLFELVCAIPPEAWVKEELYEGEDAQNTTMEGQVKRMLTAVRAMYNEVYVNGRVKAGKDVAEAQKVFNACASAFKTIANFEKEVFTLSRQQAVERATVKLLKERYPHLTEEFLKLLEEELVKQP